MSQKFDQLLCPFALVPPKIRNKQSYKICHRSAINSKKTRSCWSCWLNLRNHDVYLRSMQKICTNSLLRIGCSGWQVSFRISASSTPSWSQSFRKVLAADKWTHWWQWCPPNIIRCSHYSYGGRLWQFISFDVQALRNPLATLQFRYSLLSAWKGRQRKRNHSSSNV